jgi:hypothetical protein
LAGVASAIANRRTECGDVVNLSGGDADRHLADFEVADLRGIGPRYAEFLKSEGETDSSPTRPCTNIQTK